MKKNINRQVRECDQCSVEACKDEGAYGNSPFIGWITVKMEVNPAVSRIPDPLDFCSFDCMQDYFKEGGTWYGNKDDSFFLKREE